MNVGYHDSRRIAGGSAVLLIVFFLAMFPISLSARTTTYGITTGYIKQLEGAIETFRLEYGRYPSQGEGSNALVVNELYFRELPLDTWGRPFAGRHCKDSYDLYSLGEDGKSKTGGSDPDDINQWDLNQTWLSYYRRKGYWEDVRQFAVYRFAPYAAACMVLLLLGALFRSLFRRLFAEEA